MELSGVCGGCVRCVPKGLGQAGMRLEAPAGRLYIRRESCVPSVATKKPHTPQTFPHTPKNELGRRRRKQPRQQQEARPHHHQHHHRRRQSTPTPAPEPHALRLTGHALRHALLRQFRGAARAAPGGEGNQQLPGRFSRGADLTPDGKHKTHGGWGAGEPTPKHKTQGAGGLCYS